MSGLFDEVRKRPRTWLLSVIVLTVVTGLLVGWSGRCLKTPSAPLGIISLELAWDQHQADTIRNEWNRAIYSEGEIIMDIAFVGYDGVTVWAAARKNIRDDIFFLIAYTLFYIVCVVRMDPSRLPGQPVTRRTFVFAHLALVAGLLDGIENFFMWMFLLGHDIYSYAFALPATIKFLIVLALTIYILLYLFRKLLSRAKS